MAAPRTSRVRVEAQVVPKHGRSPWPPNNSLQLTRLACRKLERDLPARMRENEWAVARAAGQLKAIVRQSPRNFGKETSLWTLELAAEVSFEQGLIPERVSDETIRNTLKRLGVQWKRAKQWITSPDPAYGRKKTTGTA